MGLAGDAGIRVPGPECKPSRFGLLSVAELAPQDDNKWARGLEWDELDCSYAPGVVTPCPPVDAEKSYTRGFDTRVGDPFAIYAGWECSAIGVDDMAWDNADELLTRKWQRTLERVMWDGVDQDGNVIHSTLATSGAIDLTPAGGAFDPTSGVAVLESFAGDCFDCVPIIHANRGLATYLAERGLIAIEGFEQTMIGTGTRVAVGGGYGSGGPLLFDEDNPEDPPLEQPAEPGEAWMYITGSVRITTGPRFFTPNRGDLAGASNRLSNDFAVLAEQFAAIQVGCCVGAVRVTLSACCCGIGGS